MTVTDLPDAAQAAPDTTRLVRRTPLALLARDLVVLDKDLKEFLANTLMQPLMLVFIFTYVFPRIGQGIGGEGNVGRFSTLLLGGMVAQSIIFTGLFRVALPLAREFDITNELQDRVLAPVSIATVALERLLAGAVQALFAGMVVFPVAAFLPSTPIYLRAHWVNLILVTPLACLTSAALGLTVGTWIEARLVPVLVGFIALPLGFFGAIFYTWDGLTPIPWLKWAVLVNPLVYMSEGFRAGLSIGVVHMPLVVICAALTAFCGFLAILGIKGFTRRVLS